MNYPERVKVVYVADEVLSDFDDKLREKMRELGYDWYGRGYDIGTRERDSAYEYIAERRKGTGEH